MFTKMISSILSIIYEMSMTGYEFVGKPFPCEIKVIAGVVFCFMMFIYAFVFRQMRGFSGIHYVNQERCRIDMNVEFDNHFSFEVDHIKPNFSGIEGVLKCQSQCHISVFWGVPINHLFDLLAHDWVEIFNLVSDINQLDGFASKCAFAGCNLVLYPDEEKTMEFHKPPNLAESIFKGNSVLYLRDIYPLVIMSVLIPTPEFNGRPFVIVNAYAVHVPDQASNELRTIGHFIKLSTGLVGQVKKMYSSFDEQRQNDLCIICFRRRACIVQIACLHSCVCRRCYDKCDKCPMCRNANMNYFELPYNSEDVQASDSSSSAEDN